MVTIRIAQPSDASVLAAIYRPYVETTDITFEYDAPSDAEFAARIAETLKKYPYLIAEENGAAVGYAYAGTFKGRPAYNWAVEVTVYVKMGCSGRGIGTLLYAELERWLRRQNIINLNACITHPNEKSEAFHRKLGYRTVAHFTRCGYKLGAWKDMVWMEKFLSEHPAVPEPVIPFSALQSAAQPE